MYLKLVPPETIPSLRFKLIVSPLQIITDWGATLGSEFTVTVNVNSPPTTSTPPWLLTGTTV